MSILDEANDDGAGVVPCGVENRGCRARRNALVYRAGTVTRTGRVMPRPLRLRSSVNSSIAIALVP